MLIRHFQLSGLEQAQVICSLFAIVDVIGELLVSIKEISFVL